VGKHRHEFKPLWPFVIPEEYRNPADEELLAALTECRRRHKTVVASGKFSRLTAVTRAMDERNREASHELYEARADLGMRRLLAGMVHAAERLELPPATVVQAFMAIHFRTAVHRGEVPGANEILRHLRTGVCYTRPRADELDMRREAIDMLRGRITQVADRRDELEEILWYVSDDMRGIDPALSVLEQSDDADVLVLFDPDLDKELLDAALAGECGSGPLSAAAISELAAYCDELLNEHTRTTSVASKYMARVRHALTYIREPLEYLDDAELRGRDHNAFLFAATTGYAAMFMADTRDRSISSETARLLADLNESPSFSATVVADDTILSVFGTCPEVWYVVLQQLLAGCGGLKHDGFESWALSLLVDMVRHPATFRKHRHSGADKAKSLLHRFVAPALIGFHPPLEETFCKLEELELLPPRHVLLLFAEHCADAFALEPDECDDSGCFRSAQQRAVAAKAISTFILPHLPAIVDRLIEDFGAEEGYVPSLDDLADFPFDFEPEELEWEVPAVTPVEEVVWHYLPNPANPRQRDELVLSADGGVGVLERYFRKKRVGTVVKSESILGALDYFREMPEASRILAPKESIGGDSWVKLKRGKLRILAREDDHGALLFHIYPRKVWKSDMFERR